MTTSFSEQLEQAVSAWVEQADQSALLSLCDDRVVVDAPGERRVGVHQVSALLAHPDRSGLLTVLMNHFAKAPFYTVAARLECRFPAPASLVRAYALAATFLLRESRVVRIWLNAPGLFSSTGHASDRVPRRDWTCWKLTPREQSVAHLVMQGRRDKEVAQQLGLSPRSVAKYLQSILRKSGATARWELAERAGIVRVG